MSPNPATTATSSLLSAEDFARVQAGYASGMEVGPHTEPRLRSAIEHVLANPGSLVRAQLAYHILAARAVAEPDALAVAVAIEYFHTASLVFDDMPAMDQRHRATRLALRARARSARPPRPSRRSPSSTRAYALLWQAIGPLPPKRPAARPRCWSPPAWAYTAS
jgi:hypothetical protein